ncbi:MAG: RT0821/Lpp0805 family surface protein [Deferrisomatales bacterium]|nr:RT0821/Lpp0805 family surface protein [Deferrisomatales bacterium]
MRGTSAAAVALALAVLWGAAQPLHAAAGTSRGGTHGFTWGPRHYPLPAAVHRPPCPPPRKPSYGRRPPVRPDHRHTYTSTTVVYRPYTSYSGGKELLGNVIGGAVGGVLGAQIGGGTGRTAAVVGGTVLGLLVGGSVGRSMDAADRLAVGHTLETAPTRTVVAWQNPDSGTRYEVTPLATYEAAGRYCREYTATALVAGQRQQIYGTACRQPDGTWEVVR